MTIGMHIGINAQLLSVGNTYRNSGVSRYIRYLLTELARQPGDHTYTVFVNGQEVIESLGIEQPAMTFVAAPWPETRPVARVAWEQFTLPTLLRQRQIDVLHSPVNVLPEWLPSRCATVVTLHDLAFLRFPHVLTRSKRLYHRTFTIRSLQRASCIISVSESTKQDAHTLVGIPEARIYTVYPCINARFSRVMEEKWPVLQHFREQKGLAEGFILYLGTLEPRKNIPTLLDAYAQLREQHARREKLVLAGSKGWLYDTIFAKVRQLGLEEEVLFPGYVSDEEQLLWYQAATAFAYPSLYEGFGIPVAEALACGTPVVTTTVSSLPEAGAGIALTVDPNDSNGLAHALYKAITDTTWREQCWAQASCVAQRFSAQTMASQTRAVYEQAAAVHATQKRSQHISYAR
jgi:glycosyltransferase involved in cell wall biosynthesis